MLHLDFLMKHVGIRANSSGFSVEALATQAQEKLELKLRELISQVIPQSPIMEAVAPIMEAVAPTLRQRAAKRKVGG